MTPFLKILPVAAALVAAPAFALAADPPAAQTSKPAATAPGKDAKSTSTAGDCCQHHGGPAAGDANAKGDHCCADHMAHGHSGHHHHGHHGGPPADQPKPPG